MEHENLYSLAAEARKEKLSEVTLGAVNGAGYCVLISEILVYKLRSYGVKAKRASGFYNNYWHSWVELPDINTYVDATHDQFIPNTIIKIGSLFDHDYLTLYKTDSIVNS
jgi:hypothetical protein